MILHSGSTVNNNIQIQIMSNDYFWRIDENNQTCDIFLKGAILPKRVVKFPFQSDLTNKVCESLISKNKCNLVEYENSLKDHIYILKILRDGFSERRVDILEGCPIT